LRVESFRTERELPTRRTTGVIRDPQPSTLNSQLPTGQVAWARAHFFKDDNLVSFDDEERGS